MKHIIVGGIVGGIILFLWGWMSWTVLPLHNSSVRAIENEDRVAEVLSTSIGAHGVYVLPHVPDQNADMSAEELQIAMDDWTKKYQQGPLAMIVYDPRGADPMMPSVMVNGFVINVLAAMMVVWLLSRSTAMTASLVGRISYCGVIGVLISFSSHLMMWNWMNFPLDYTTAMVADTVIGWLLAGAGIGAIVKAPASAATV
jgi:hypothetical protein